MDPVNIPPSNFKTAFCNRFAYPQENFEKHVFWKAMHPEIRPVVFLIRCFRPNFFRSDLACIRRIAAAETKEEVSAILESLEFDPAFNRGIFRGLMEIRISGRRLMQLAGDVLANRR